MKKSEYSLLILGTVLVGFPVFSGAHESGGHDTADSGSGYTIANTVNTFSMDHIEKTKVGYQYWFADKKFADGKTLKMSAVKPRAATHEPHVHEEDEFFFVLEGTAEFYLDGKTTVAGPYTSFYCPSNMKHGIRNVGDTDLKYLVIKKYQDVD